MGFKINVMEKVIEQNGAPISIDISNASIWICQGNDTVIVEIVNIPAFLTAIKDLIKDKENG